MPIFGVPGLNIPKLNLGWTEDDCIEFGHMASWDNPNKCQDCGADMEEDVSKKAKYKKKTKVTKGSQKPPEPRVYRPLEEFAEFIPVAPPEDVRPKDPVGTSTTTTSTSHAGGSFGASDLDDFYGYGYGYGGYF